MKSEAEQGMHLVVDVGNTEAVIGVFRSGDPQIHRHWRYSTAVPRTGHELRLLLRAFLQEEEISPHAIRRGVIGSVVPAHTKLLEDALDGLGVDRVHVVDSEAGLPIRLEVDEPRTVGADRIVNTLAAARLFARDTIVVDMGTATTYDCITGDGVFVGGVIAPGLQAGQDWLKGHTAKLPRVELKPPADVIGRRTESCLQSGIFYSAVDAVDGVVERIRQAWGRPDAFVVSTGGWASVLSPHTRTVQEIHPHLTLLGLEFAGQYLSEESKVDEGVAATR